MALQSFDDWLKAWIKRLPRRLSEIILSALALLSWVSAPVNFLSQIAHLQIVVDFWRSLLANFGQISALLRAVSEIVGPVVLAWRQFLEPLRAWIEAVLTVQVPFVVLHAGLMLLFCVPAIARYFLASTTIVVRRSALKNALSEAFADPFVAANYRNRKDPYREPAEIIAETFANGGPDADGVKTLEARFQKRSGPLAYLGIGLLPTNPKVARVLKLCSRIRRDLGVLRNSVVFLAFAAFFAAAGFVLVLANEFA